MSEIIFLKGKKKNFFFFLIKIINFLKKKYKQKNILKKIKIWDVRNQRLKKI
jgi:hypothetical protein